MIVYFNGQFLPKKDISISPDDRGFLFADGIYEVIRSYQGQLFQCQAHIRRLESGATALHFNRTDFNEFSHIAKELIEINQLTQKEATIYIQVTRGTAPRSHQFPSIETPLTIYAEVKVFVPKTSQINNGIKAILVPDYRWSMCNVKSTALIVNTMAHQQAIDAGAQEAIFVRNGFLTEGAHTNVLLIKNNSVITPPKTNYILGGITREVVLNCCYQHSISVEERSINEKELYDADELMLSGTTVEITPIVQLNQKIIGTGSPGPMTRKIQELFRKFREKS